MTPKIIHLCWFSDDPYPVQIQACLNTWRHLLPDYKVRLWDADAARSIGCPFIDEALRRHRWAYAADAVRFYAVWKEVCTWIAILACTADGFVGLKSPYCPSEGIFPTDENKKKTHISHKL